MHPTEPETSSHPICTDPAESLAVTMYVRPTISAACRRQVEAVRTRLDSLAETSLLERVSRRDWPPQNRADDTSAESTPTREALVSEFERWAEDNGYSLRPAVRRNHVQPSMLGPEQSQAEICVPILLLAFYDSETADTLRGVVPYTIDYGTEQATICTVCDWLQVAEEVTAGGDSQHAFSAGSQLSSLNSD